MQTPWRPLKKLPRHAGGDRSSKAQGKDIEIWFQDEARIGQKNKITRRWAKRGTRPSAPHDQRTRSAARDWASVNENSPRRCAISGRTRRLEAYDEAENRPFTRGELDPAPGFG